MVKSIIKEIIIILLLLLAIVLALGVLFYDYIPTNKTVPSVATYTTSETIKNELAEEETKEDEVIVTYEITASDLKTYEKTKDYTKGKVNPFSTYEATTSDENSVTDVNSINTTTNTNNTKSNTFYNSTGTK